MNEGFDSQIEAEKQRCAELIAKQEEKLVEAHADINERDKELEQVRATLDSLSGVQGSGATGWKLTLIQHAEIIVGAFGVTLLIVFIAAYLCGRSRGRRQGLTMKRGGDDYLFDGRSSAAAAAAVGAKPNSSPATNSNLNVNNDANNSQHQQQVTRNNINYNNAPPPPQQTTELRNRALHRFDGGV